MRKHLVTAVAVGLLLAIAVGFLPAPMLETAVTRIGLAALLPQAAPPLGGTARMMFAAFAFAIGLAGMLLVARRGRHAIDEADAPSIIDPDPSWKPITPDMPTTDIAPPIPHLEPVPSVAPMSPEPAVDPAPSAATDLAELTGAIRQLDAAVAALPGLIERSIKVSAPARSRALSLDDLVARIEAHERRVADHLSDIADRMTELVARQTETAHRPAQDALPPLDAAPLRPRITDPEKARRLSGAIADVRRMIDTPTDT